MFGAFGPFHTKDGWDRDLIFTLFLAGIVFFISGGLVLIPCAIRVVWVALHSPCNIDPPVLLFVFGKKLEDGKIDSDYRMRLTRVAQIISTVKQYRLVLMGGKTGGNRISEAEAGAAYLAELGVAQDDRMLLENKSSHTLENLRNAREIIMENDVPPVLATNRYHLARCSILASSLGISHALCGAEETFVFNLSSIGKIFLESLLILWFFTGKKWASITGNRRMLARIQ